MVANFYHASTNKIMTCIMDILTLRTAIPWLYCLLPLRRKPNHYLNIVSKSVQSQPMTVVKYNNCESIGQNTTEYRSDRRYLGWVGGWNNSELKHVGRQHHDDGQNKFLQINDSKENLSYIIIRMNLIQYKKLKTLALVWEEFYWPNFKLHLLRLEMQALYKRRENLWFAVINRTTTTSETPLVL
jgi:hypothetical protein